MIRSLLAVPIALLLAAFTLNTDPLEIGSTLPMGDIEVATTDGETLTLAGSAGENGLLVMFTCNTCPYVHAWEDRFNGIAAQAEELGIGFVALNPNAALRGTTESMAAMAARAEEHGYTFPYAVDAENRLADAFGATRTPEVFLFSNDEDGLRLIYHGAIDDNAKDLSAVKAHYLRDAMQALANGEAVAKPTSRSVGCTIKRVS